MRTINRTAVLLFLATVAVCSDQANTGDRANDTGTEVVSLPETLTNAPDPAKVSKGPTTVPVVAATQPASVGRSVSASEVAVSKDSGTVEIHVNDANLVEVLRMLSMQANTNILPSKDVRGTITANLYDVTIKEALDAILTANGFGYREKGNVIYVYSAKEIADMEKNEHKKQTEVFHLFYTPAVNAQTMIKPVLSADGQVAVTTPAVAGIASDPTNAGGNNHAEDDMLVVTDYPENLDRVRKVLKDIDRRPQQILVEATILSAQLHEDNSMGIDFSLLGGVDFSNLAGAPNVTGPLAANGGLASQTSSGTTGTTGTTGTAGTTGNGIVGYSSANTGFTQSLPTGGLRVGFVYNNVAAFIQALEETTNTTVLANPKVLVLNKQKGEVKVARQDPYRGKTTVNENGLSQQEVDFLETGTLLIFRPYIADDGYIRLEVHPEDSTPLPSTASDLPPTKLTTETTTNVMVRDGHTIVIGGMFREVSQVSKQQIPGLGNIPLLGRLFGNQQDTTTRQEVIILLTPHVIKDEGLYDQLSKDQQREAERLRVGVRKGMMPWGRERLADAHYEQAVKEWNKPNPDIHKVLWNLDCATNLNPTFTEAIDLKVKVSGKEVTAADNSSIRYFMRDLIVKDRLPVTMAPTTQAVSVSNFAATQPAFAKSNLAATQPIAKKPAIDEDEEFADADDDSAPALPATRPASTLTAATSQPAKIQPSPGVSVTITELPEDDAVNDAPQKSDK